MAKLTDSDLQAISDAADRHAQLLDAIRKAYEGGNVIETFARLRELFQTKEKEKIH